MGSSKILQDYGIQPNQKRQDESFVEFSERTTWFYAMTKALQRHSEFMEPWKDDYPRMEYAYPDPHGIQPVTNLENRTRAELAPFGQCMLTCFSPLYCHEPVQCHMNVSQCPQGVGWLECVKAQSFRVWLDGTEGLVDTKLIPENVYPFEILPQSGGWNAWPDEATQELKVRGKDAAGNICETSLKVFCRDYDFCCTGAGYTNPAIDDDPDTVAPGGSLTVAVAGGCSPYNWQVSGTGWSWDAAQTVVGSNTLRLADTACGTHSATASVIVADKCGNSDTALFRTTAGWWKRLSPQPAQAEGCSSGFGDGELSGHQTRWQYADGYAWCLTTLDSFGRVRGCRDAVCTGWLLGGGAIYPPCGLPCACADYGGCTGPGAPYPGYATFFTAVWACDGDGTELTSC